MTVLDRAAERVSKSIYDLGYKAHAIDHARTIAAAALAESAWQDIKDAPEMSGPWGLMFGYWNGPEWCTLAINADRPVAFFKTSCITHFRLNPAPPPRSK